VRLVTILVLVGLLVLAVASFMFTYTVRFTEAAVVTTFGQADERSIVTRPGPGLRLPYPIQNVTKYDTRIRFMSTRQEAQQTADDRQVVVEAFATYRVVDPRRFFERFSNAGERAEQHFERAEEILRSNLRSALGELSRYRMSELFTRGGDGSRLPELEERVLRSMRQGGTAGESLLDEYGIEVVSVGISSIVFPQDVTRAVFERMKAERQKLASDLESQGSSRADTIRAEAVAAAQSIEAFAEQRAAQVRALGEREAAEFIAALNSNPELAVFLAHVEFLRESLTARQATLLFDTRHPGFELLDRESGRGVGQAALPRLRDPMGEDREGERAQPAGRGGDR